MAEIEITLPTVQYGNVKVRATPEELGVNVSEPGSVGIAAAIYLNLFTQGFKRGTQMDVTLDPEPASEVDQVIDETLRNAQKLMEQALGGVTEVPGDDPENMHHDPEPLDPKAPWNSTVDTNPKPWENEEAAPKAALDASW